MKPAHLKTLKSLENSPQKLKNKLIELLSNDEITIKQIITSCKEQKLDIPALCFTDIGLMYSQAKDGFKKDIKKAFKLYKFAADKLEDRTAYGNVAQYYLDGRAPDGADLEKAEEYCLKAIELGADQHYLMGCIYQQKQEFTEAIQQFRLVEQNSKLWEKTQKAIKNCLVSQLVRTYAQVNATETEASKTYTEEDGETVASSQTNTDNDIDVKQLPGWITISDSLDGFDSNECDELKTAKQKIVSLEKKISDALETIGEISEQLKYKTSNQYLAELIKTVKAKQSELSQQSEQLTERKTTLEDQYKLYMDTEKRTLHRQYQTELRFFDPSRTCQEKTLLVAKELMTTRIATQATNKSIDVSQIPVRRLITAERSTIEVPLEALKLYENADYRGYIENNGSTVNPDRTKKGQGYSGTYTQEYGFDEIITLGQSTIKYRQRVNPHRNHLGDFYMLDLGKYEKINDKLNQITGTTDDTVVTKNEQELAKLMLDFCHGGKPITLEKLKKIYKKADDSNVHDINRIFYHCFVKEIASWMLPRDKSHQLPLATAQARALQLIVKGYLTIGEVFSQDAQYGVFTGSNIGENPNKLREKIILINRLYDKAMLEMHTDNAAQSVQFFKKHPDGKTLPTRKELHQELRDTFGGESDTDGEGYESDNEKKELYQSIIQACD